MGWLNGGQPPEIAVRVYSSRSCAKPMTYTIEQLAVGSYDVLLDGIVVASLVRSVHRNGPGDTWQVKLLDEVPAAERPAPFANQRHVFKSRLTALEWLGIQGADATAGPTG
jgi:hypothetical protein